MESTAGTGVTVGTPVKKVKTVTKIDLQKYRGICTYSKLIKYEREETPAKKDDDAMMTMFKEESKSKQPKYEVAILYQSKSGLRFKVLKCGSRGSIDATNTVGEVVDQKRQKFSPILVDSDKFQVENVNLIGGILNPKFWEANLNWLEPVERCHTFEERLIRLDKLIKQRF